MSRAVASTKTMPVTTDETSKQLSCSTPAAAPGTKGEEAKAVTSGHGCCCLGLGRGFFSDSSVILLRSVGSKVLCSGVLLGLCLGSLGGNKGLRLSRRVPCATRVVTALAHRRVKAIRETLRVFQRLKLIRRLSDKTFCVASVRLVVKRSSARTRQGQTTELRGGTLLPPQAGNKRLSSVHPPRVRVRLRGRVRVRGRERKRAKRPTPTTCNECGGIVLASARLSKLGARLPSG